MYARSIRILKCFSGSRRLRCWSQDSTMAVARKKTVRKFKSTVDQYEYYGTFQNNGHFLVCFLTLVMMEGGGASCAPHSLIIF